MTYHCACQISGRVSNDLVGGKTAMAFQYHSQNHDPNVLMDKSSKHSVTRQFCLSGCMLDLSVFTFLQCGNLLQVVGLLLRNYVCRGRCIVLPRGQCSRLYCLSLMI